MIPRFGPERVEDWLLFYEVENLKEEHYRAEDSQFSFGLVEMPVDIQMELGNSLWDM